MSKKITKSLTVIVFVILIFGISIVNLIKKDKAFSESENRYLEQMPTFSMNTLLDGSFIKAFEDYTTDQFLWRDGFIGVKTTTEFGMGKKDTNGVYFADDGYLIAKHDDFDETQIAKNIKFLSEFTSKTQSILGEKNVSVMIVPTASEVLTDKLPPLANDFDQTGLITEITDNLGTVAVPNILKTLTQCSHEDIYYKTDHHWTTLGAFYSYRAWCDAVGIAGHTIDDYTKILVTDEFYGTVYSKARLINTKPDSIYRFDPVFDASYSVEYNMGERTTDTLYSDEFLEKRDKYSYFLGGNNPIVKITSNNKNGKKLVLIKDSFGHSIAPLLANDFEEVHMLDLRYINISVQDYIKQNGITDALVLYNTVNFATDTNIFKITR